MKKSKPRLHGLLPWYTSTLKKNRLPVSVFINNLSMHKLKHSNPYLLKMEKKINIITITQGYIRFEFSWYKETVPVIYNS